MAYSNGRIPESNLSPVPGGKLADGAAIAWNDMRAYIIKHGGPAIMPAGPNSTYRPITTQRHFWHLYQTGQGNVAAVPGTSNHGWGKAVDVETMEMANWIRKVDHLFGWSYAEGARVGEWWHFTYVGSYKRKKKFNPLSTLSHSERKWLVDYIYLKKANKNRARRTVLRALLARQRKMVYRKGQREGWTKSLKIRWHLLAKYS